MGGARKLAGSDSRRSGESWKTVEQMFVAHRKWEVYKE
jgi:hypothetical protein